jgi:hypothetical protein
VRASYSSGLQCGRHFTYFQRTDARPGGEVAIGVRACACACVRAWAYRESRIAVAAKIGKTEGYCYSPANSMWTVGSDVASR